MGERKGQLKYYPPDFDPATHGNLNAYHGTHALRERARKRSEGIFIIRFEMPYNIWCSGCNNHIGMGVRYNAEKTRAGNYYSTPIYKFRMKCHLCDNHFEIQTDPKNFDYEILNGARRQERRYDPAQYDQLAHDREESHKLNTDAMHKLEKGLDEQVKSREAKSSIEQLRDEQHDRRKDDYSSNSSLRSTFRQQKLVAKLQQEANDRTLSKYSLQHSGIDLLSVNDDDRKMAKLLSLEHSVVDTAGGAEDEKIQRKRDRLLSVPMRMKIRRKKLTTTSSTAAKSAAKMTTTTRSIVTKPGNSSARSVTCSSASTETKKQTALATLKNKLKIGHLPLATKR